MEESREARRNPGSEPADVEGLVEVDGLGFEAALEELEGLVDRLEDGDLALEQALATFERGVVLSRRCADLLERAERRIEVLVREGGGLQVRPLEDAPVREES